MSHAILILSDAAFDDLPFVVLGVTAEHVAGLAVDYLRAAQPAVHTGRLEVPADKPVGGWHSWLMANLPDIEDIEISIHDTDTGDLMPAGVFMNWISEHGGKLHDQHTPHVVDVIKSL